jgi:hypothetical protein
MPSEIANYEAKVDAAFTAIGATVDSIVTSVTGVSGDVDRLKALIKQLQDNPGPISPEDQALLDKSEQAVNALAGRMSGVKDALASLDAATEEAPTA